MLTKTNAMKSFTMKSLFLITMMLMGMTMFSQTFPKKGLFEMFTSSTCDPCVAGNANLDNILGNNPGEYSLIKYQMNWPTGGDPYYTAQGGVRRDYYGISGIPDLRVNSVSEDAAAFSQADFDQYASLVTNMDIDVTASIQATGIITINATINTTINYAAGLKAYIVVVEKTTEGNYKWNGETEFHKVMMVMLPGAEGTTLGALTSGTPVQLSQNCDMNTTFMEEPTDLAVIVFVQDDSNKEVFQSEMVDVAPVGINTYTISMNVKDDQGNPVSETEVELEAHAKEITGPTGQVFYNTAFPRTYSYRVFKQGFDVVYDSLTVVNQNIVLDVVLHSPNAYLLYEDFEGSNIPTEWAALYTDPNSIYIAFDEAVVLLRDMTGGDLRLVSPPIQMSHAGTIFIEAGQSNQYPNTAMVVGTVPEPTATAPFTELTRFIPQQEGFGWFEFDLSTYSGSDQYLAFEYDGPNGWYVIETIKVSDMTVGVDEKLVSPGMVHCYPNPSDGYIHIKSQTNIQNVKITNQLGEIIYRSKTSGRDLTIDTDRYKPGVYFIEVTTPAGVETQKLIRK
jgi:hypothetical protein